MEKVIFGKRDGYPLSWYVFEEQNENALLISKEGYLCDEDSISSDPYRTFSDALEWFTKDLFKGLNSDEKNSIIETEAKYPTSGGKMISKKDKVFLLTKEMASKLSGKNLFSISVETDNYNKKFILIVPNNYDQSEIIPYFYRKPYDSKLYIATSTSMSDLYYRHRNGEENSDGDEIYLSYSVLPCIWVKKSALKPY